MATTATIGGYTILNDGPVTWDQADGVEPVVQTFTLLATDAKALLASKAGKPIALQISQSGYTTQIVQQLYVLHLVAGSKLNPDGSPFDLGVVIADQRWLWPYQHVGATFNVLRREGQTQTLVEGEPQQAVPAQVVAASPNLQYAPWSLQPSGQPWTALAMLNFVLQRVVGPNFTISIARGQAVKGFELEHEGHMAIDATLAYLAGAVITVSSDGTVDVRDARDGSEVAAVNALAPYAAGGPLALIVDHSIERPSAVRVLFSTELETRLNAANPEDAVFDQSAAAGDSRTIVNVAPVPDFFLVIPGLGAAGADSELGPGAWVPFPQLTEAWAANRQGGLWPITTQALRLSYLHPGNMTSLFLDPAGVANDPVVVQRLSTALEHFRLTYQISRPYLDRCSRIYPWRASMQYFGSQQRAPAVMYGDWSCQWTVREAPNIVAPGFDVQNMSGWTTTGQLAGAKVAPFTVDVIDEQQGIIHLTPKGDVWGRTANIFPGLCYCPPPPSPGEDPFQAILNGTSQEQSGSGPSAAVALQKTLPTDDPSQPNAAPILFESACLADGYQMAIVLTVVPAAPNDDRRFYCATITPAQASATLGRPLGQCVGPVKTIKIGSDLISARFAWSDSASAAFDQAMGLNAGGGANFGTAPGPIGIPGSSVKSGQCIGEPGGPQIPLACLVNQQDILDVANAAAASVYNRFMDRMEGGVTVPSADVTMTGNMGSATTTLAPDGRFMTTVGLPGIPPEVDMLAFLPQSTRRRLGLIIQKRGSTTG